MSLAINNPLFSAVNMFALSTFLQHRQTACLHPANCQLLQEKRKLREKQLCFIVAGCEKNYTAHYAGHVSPSVLVGWQPCLMHKAMDVVLRGLTTVMDSMQAKWKAQVCSEDEDSS